MPGTGGRICVLTPHLHISISSTFLLTPHFYSCFQKNDNLRASGLLQVLHSSSLVTVTVVISSSTSACTSIGRQHTEQSSMYCCSCTEVSIVISIDSPQYGQYICFVSVYTIYPLLFTRYSNRSGQYVMMSTASIRINIKSMVAA